MLTVVLVGPENAGNVGAVARSMKNFGLKSLVLVDPKCDHLSKEALDRASHAKDILKKAKVLDDLKGFDTKIATTAVLGTDYNITRSPLLPGQLAGLRGKTALLFGRESHGLSNEEISRCDFVVTIPASKRYPTMNISHAAAILFYEIFKSEKPTSHFQPASAKDKEVILKRFDDILDSMKFSTAGKKKTQRKVWKRIIGKSFLTKREAFAVLGFLRKLKRP